MCIRIQYAPRREIADPYDATRQLITIPDNLAATVLFSLRAVRAVLHELGVEQPAFGARCWCGEPIELLDCIPQQQQRSGQVVTHGA